MLLLIAGAVQAQVSPERQAWNSLQKGKWEKSKSQAMKALRKDTLNIPARYVLGRYFFTSANPAYNIDSAYGHAVKAMTDFRTLPARQQERIKRFPVDSLILVQFRQQIDSAGFARAIKLNTEEAYIQFIGRHTDAEQLDRARELRDEVAFIDALKENTYTAFFSYLQRYPNASRTTEARERYERLLFETKTKDRRLKSYELFLEEYPETPYRPQAEQQIFELSTAPGSVATFIRFIERYPQSAWVKRAANLAYHILKEQEELIPAILMTDSLANLRQLEQGYLVPFYKDGRFGFLDGTGAEVIAPVAETLDETYLCGNITEDILFTGNALRARNGQLIYSGEVSELEDIDFGFLLVSDEDCTHLIHKSGFRIASCIEDARVLAGSLLAIKEKSEWRVKTFTGRELPLGEFEYIDHIEQVIVFRQAGKYKLLQAVDAALSADQQQPVFSKPVDEVKRWNSQLLWVKIDNQEGLWDQSFQEEIKPEQQTIVQLRQHALLKSANGVVLWNQEAGRSDTYEVINVHQPWITARKNNTWYLLDEKFRPAGNRVFDSLAFAGAFLLGFSKDSTRVLINDRISIPIPVRATAHFLPGKDSVYYLMIDEGERKTIYNSAGERLFTGVFDRLEYAGEQLFLAVRREKRGLVNLQGKYVVPAEYDAMGMLQQGTVPVLKDKKFGYLDVIHRKEIKPLYEKNLQRYNDYYLIAHRNGLNGIIDWNNKPVTGFDYEEIQFWNDSTALVKRNFQWQG